MRTAYWPTPIEQSLFVMRMEDRMRAFQGPPRQSRYAPRPNHRGAWTQYSSYAAPCLARR